MHLNVLLLLKVHAIVWGSMIVSGESVCQNHSDASVRLRLVYAGWKYIMPAGCHKTTGKKEQYLCFGIPAMAVTCPLF